MTENNKELIREAIWPEEAEDSHMIEDIVESLSSKLIESYYYMKIAKRSFEKEGLQESADYTDRRMNEIEILLKEHFGSEFEI